jgi:tetratricopeptide (TPR) repeat protein
MDDFQFEISFCRSLLVRDPQDLTAMEMLAGYCTRAGDIDEGLAWDHKIVSLNPDNAVSHYNLACSLALKRRSDEALAALREALARGYRDFDWMMEDPDLAVLQEHPGFSSLLAEYQAQS